MRNRKKEGEKEQEELSKTGKTSQAIPQKQTDPFYILLLMALFLPALLWVLAAGAMSLAPSTIFYLIVGILTFSIIFFSWNSSS
jgi:hypothetical protein